MKFSFMALVLLSSLTARAKIIADISNTWVPKQTAIERVVSIDDSGAVTVVIDNGDPKLLLTLSRESVAQLAANISRIDDSRKLPISDCAERIARISHDGQTFQIVGYSTASGRAPACNQFNEQALTILTALDGFLDLSFK